VAVGDPVSPSGTSRTVPSARFNHLSCLVWCRPRPCLAPKRARGSRRRPPEWPHHCPPLGTDLGGRRRPPFPHTHGGTQLPPLQPANTFGKQAQSSYTAHHIRPSHPPGVLSPPAPPLGPSGPRPRALKGPTGGGSSSHGPGTVLLPFCAPAPLLVTFSVPMCVRVWGGEGRPLERHANPGIFQDQGRPPGKVPAGDPTCHWKGGFPPVMRGRGGQPRPSAHELGRGGLRRGPGLGVGGRHVAPWAFPRSGMPLRCRRTTASRRTEQRRMTLSPSPETT